MALSAAIAALPTVIESISKMISGIDDLSKKKVKQDEVINQNKNLKDALEKLKESAKNIGLSIRDYADIYNKALKEETTAKALALQFSLGKEKPRADNDTSIQNGFERLKTAGLALKESVDDNKDEIEKEDFTELDKDLSVIQVLFSNLEEHITTNTKESLTAATADINKICTNLSEISSLLNRRFKKMSTALMGIPKLPSKS